MDSRIGGGYPRHGRYFGYRRVPEQKGGDPTKALILADLEGASGITNDRLSWTRVHTEDWERFGRDRITADVAAAARGALAGGAEAVTVTDVHDIGDSLRPHTVHDPIADIRYNGRSLGNIGLFAGCFGALVPTAPSAYSSTPGRGTCMVSPDTLTS